jgi:putative component of toxin-antitoxin plasmid stabilization module
LARIQQGNFSSAKGVGASAYEFWIDFGPDTGFTSVKMAIFRHSSWRRHEKAPAGRHRHCAGPVAGL